MIFDKDFPGLGCKQKTLSEMRKKSFAYVVVPWQDVKENCLDKEIVSKRLNSYDVKKFMQQKGYANEMDSHIKLLLFDLIGELGEAIFK